MKLFDDSLCDGPRHFAICWETHGDVRSDQGDLLGALQAYTESKTIADRLAYTDSGNPEWQRDRLVCWDGLGDVCRAQGNLTGALQAYTESKNIANRVAQVDPENAQWQREIGRAHV